MIFRLLHEEHEKIEMTCVKNDMVDSFNIAGFFIL